MRGLVGASLSLVVGLIAGCNAGPAPAPVGRVAVARSTPSPTVTVESVKSLGQSQSVRPRPGRNPFRFAAPRVIPLRVDRLPPLPPPEGLPELQLPLPRPAITLIGIAAGRETPPVRTAVLLVGGDLVLAKLGDVVAAQYRVAAISEDAVELVGATGQDHLRIGLR